VNDCEFDHPHPGQPCGQHVPGPGEPCNFCGVIVPTTAECCPDCWIDVADIAFADLKAAFAGINLSLSRDGS
jgi:hypothetical protein